MFQLLAHVAVFQEKLNLFHDDFKDKGFTHFNALIELNQSFGEIDIDQELLAFLCSFWKNKMESKFNEVNQTCKLVGYLFE